MERGREARRPTMAGSNGGFLRLRERPSKKKNIMREQSKKQRIYRDDHNNTGEEEEEEEKKSPPLIVGRQMIGVAVPRKARSACGKRLHENSTCGSYGGAAEEQKLQQRSVKAASLSFSSVSSRKKMKPNGPKTRPPPSSKSSPSVEEDIEIEIAGVLFGLMKQSQSSMDRESDHSDVETTSSSGGKDSMEKKVDSSNESDKPEKNEASSPSSNGELCSSPRHMGGSEGASVPMESEKVEGKPFVDEGKSIAPKVDVSWEDSTRAKAIPNVLELESKREDKLEFDLMAPPPIEKDNLNDSVSNPKSVTQDVEMKIEISLKNKEKAERYVDEFGLEKPEEKMMEMSREKINENPNQDSDSKLQHQGQSNQPKHILPKQEKTAGSPSSLSHMESSTALQTSSSLLSQPRRKRCATHHYIAHNIHLHKQFAKRNNYLPAPTDSSPLCGTKSDILKVILPAENIVIGNPSLQNYPGPDLQHAPKKEKAANLEISQGKNLSVHQPPQPASASNQMHGHTFMFPLGQHQASITPTSNQSGSYAKSTNNASLSSHSAARPQRSSSALPMVAALNFNSPNMAAKEGPYLALNGYPFPISTHIGTTPAAFGGGNPAQAMPMFNGPFYSNQMFHPSQVQQQLPHSHLQRQIQPALQNTNTSSDSSPSHKQQESQKLREAQPNSNNLFTSTGIQSLESQKQYAPPSFKSCKLEGEMSGENTASPAASHAQKNVYGQNFAVPFQPSNFTLMPYVTMGGGGGSANHIEQSQQGMSFASFSGNNSTGLCWNFSTMAQSPAIFQSLPDMARQGYKVAQTPQAAQQKNHHQQISERKSGGSSNNPDDGIKSSSGKSSSTIGQRQTLVFDNSARTLNFMSSPVTGSWPPRSTASTAITTNAPVDGNTSSNSEQHHMFQFQLQNSHMLQQQQPAIAAKFPKNSPAFSQALIQCSTSVQSSQLKNSTLRSFPQQQGRASQGQTQISFGGNPKSSLAPQGPQRLTNNQSSSSISALQSQQTENSSPAASNGTMSSPACGRNLPSILSSCPSHISELKY